MVTVFPKSANQPNEMALTICNCFRLMRDRELEKLANRKEISTAPFDRKCHLLWFVYFPVSRQSCTWPKLSQGKEGAAIDRVKSHRSKHFAG